MSGAVVVAQGPVMGQWRLQHGLDNWVAYFPICPNSRALLLVTTTNNIHY